MCSVRTRGCSPADEVGEGVVQVGGEVEVLLEETADKLTEVQVQLSRCDINLTKLGSLWEGEGEGQCRVDYIQS